MKTYIKSVVLLFASCSLMITSVAQQASKKRFAISENSAEKRIDIFVDDKPFTSYIYPDVLTKPVLYPIRTSRGTLITRGWPMDPRPGERVDHPHHVGMWFNYGNVNGLDFWNSVPNMPAEKRSAYGVIRHRRVVSMKSSDEHAELEVELDWEKPDGKVLLKENTRFVFSGEGDMRTIERLTKLRAVGEDVSFADDKEGLFGIRLSRELEHRSEEPWVFTDSLGRVNKKAAVHNEGITGVYTSSEGKIGNDVWGTRGHWVRVDGTISGEAISVAILDYKDNPGYPTYWHARGYGLFAANPLGQKAFSKGARELNLKVAKGQMVSFRFKVLIYSGGHLSDDRVRNGAKLFDK
ncbi:methane monooxygenase PmoA-like [Arcticibacter pallidicorallinus]|uniref:Methane monooxygenase PmoA-like n=1 Tax=Arcticibacter pallidicorallinus TaxID=1259464 RepID=A0A2T0TYS8_9SPHI|nr:PmoA family protein [Arcticibacter pallidicorallinus]PRY50803.1 methane monooxygenase PmoA-like [Arcticibacter pallidicorallinus]